MEASRPVSFWSAQDLLSKTGNEQLLFVERSMTMGKLRDQMQRDMEIRNLSSRTTRCHLDWMRRFAGHFRKPPDELGDEEIKKFLHFLH
jgi:hypothetical protein